MEIVTRMQNAPRILGDITAAFAAVCPVIQGTASIVMQLTHVRPIKVAVMRTLLVLWLDQRSVPVYVKKVFLVMEKLALG